MTYFKGGTAQGFQSYAPFSKFLYFHLEKKNLSQASSTVFKLSHLNDFFSYYALFFVTKEGY